jgi:hypothetical protein
MTPILYGHPFASFVWKPLIALYERDVMFTFRIVDPDHPENQARIAELSPTGQFPALIDGDMEIAQSNAIIEYLDLFHGDAAPMVPSNPREAIEARMMADVFDDYVQTPMQRNGSLAMPCAHKARRILAASRTRVRRSIAATYGWTGVCKSGNGRHAAPLRSPIVLPLRLYSIPTGCIRSRTVIRRLKLIGYAFSRGSLSPVSLTRRVHIGAFSRWEPPIGTKYRALAEPRILGRCHKGLFWLEAVMRPDSRFMGPDPACSLHVRFGS